MRAEITGSLLIITCSLLLLGCQSPEPPQGITATVQRVLSGQTIEVLEEESTLLEKVRLIGINAPDRHQEPWGKDAKEKLAALMEANSTVLLEFDGKQQDSFGRTFAYVWQDGILVNEVLVAQGYVLALERSPHKYNQRLTRAQEYARIMGYGIWVRERPLRLTPQEFRQLPSPKS